MCVLMQIINMNLPVLRDCREDSAGVGGPGDVTNPAVQVECHQGLPACFIFYQLWSAFIVLLNVVSKHRLQNIKIVELYILVSVKGVLCTHA